MKRRIYFNQKAYLSVDGGELLDFIDIVILEFIYNRWMKAFKLSKLIDEHYVEVSIDSILDAFPCFGIKSKSGIRKHLRNIKKLGFIKSHPNTVNLAKTLFYITSKLEEVKKYK